jgi:hypothetical protein
VQGRGRANHVSQSRIVEPPEELTSRDIEHSGGIGNTPTRIAHGPLHGPGPFVGVDDAERAKG